MGGTWKEMNRPIDECKKNMNNLLPSLQRGIINMRTISGTGKGEYF
jgi:hypothetical protein